MAWRYENPGTVDRLTVAGTTVLGNRVSRTGVAFYQTNRKACFGIQKTSEIWIRFDVYLFDGSGIRCYNGGSAGDTGIRLNGYLTSKENSRNYWVNGKGVHENGVLNGLHTVKIHLKSGTTNGAMEVYIDDGTKVAYSFVGNVNNGAQFDSIYIQSDDNKALASNVIISDADIAMDELLNGGVQPRIYRNIGTAEGLTISGTTVATSTKSKTGTAFWQSARSDCFGLPVMDEVWMKFDLYHEAGTSRFRAYANPSTITGICLKENTSNTVISFLQNTTYNADNAYTLPSGRLQTFLLHIASDAVTGYLELWVDGTKVFNHRHAPISLLEGLYLQSDDGSNLFSNLIVSNKEIALDENADGTRDVLLGGDTERTICRSGLLAGDTRRDIVVKLFFDTRRTVAQSFFLEADTERRTARTTGLYGRTHRKVTGYVRVKGDTMRKLPARIIFHYGGQLEVRGTRQIRLSLQERTLSDRFSFETTARFNVGQRIRGELLDFPYTFDIESTSERDLVQSCTGMYDIDLLMNRPLVFRIDAGDCGYYRARIQPGNYAVHGLGRGAFASTILRKVAAGLRLPLVMDFSDFVPSAYQPSYSAEFEEPGTTAEYFDGSVTLGTTSGKIRETFEPFEAFSTYQSVLSGLFSWSSVAPRMQVNVFIRNGVIHALQRGREKGVIDLTPLPHTRPQIDREIVRTMWAGNPNGSGGGRELVWGDWYVSNATTPDDVPRPTSPVKEHEHRNADGSTTRSTFDYDDTPRGSWLNKAHVITYDKEGKEIGRASTDYSRLETGQRYGHTYDGDGTPLADTLDTYRYPDWPNETVRQSWQWWDTMTFSIDWEWKTVEGDSIAGASSIAVEDAAMRKAIYDEMKWMDRKVREEVQLDIVDNIAGGVHTIRHIFDFFTRYRLDGKEYFLMSNNVTLTPRSFIQTLRLVRWF